MARLLVGVVVGLLFGLVMSVVSNLFVITVKAATGLREDPSQICSRSATAG